MELPRREPEHQYRLRENRHHPAAAPRNQVMMGGWEGRDWRGEGGGGGAGGRYSCRAWLYVRMAVDPRMYVYTQCEDGVARRVFTDQADIFPSIVVFLPTRQTLCLHRARSAVRCRASRMKGDLHPTKNRLARRACLWMTVSNGLIFVLWCGRFGGEGSKVIARLDFGSAPTFLEINRFNASGTSPIPTLI